MILSGTTMENLRLERAKEAMAKAIQSLGPAKAIDRAKHHDIYTVRFILI